jgi:hypothetical protein
LQNRIIVGLCTDQLKISIGDIRNWPRISASRRRDLQRPRANFPSGPKRGEKPGPQHLFVFRMSPGSDRR